MITEDFVSFNTAKLLKEKGFDEPVRCFYDIRTEILCDNCVKTRNSYTESIAAPTLQRAIKWLEETHHILVVVDYIYECTDTSWVYKIYRLGENGKPERCAIRGVRYDKEKEDFVEEVVGYRDYDKSYNDYATRAEALEDGVKYVLKKLI